MNQGIENIIFWQNIASPLQVPYMRRIKENRPDWEIHLVVDSYMNEARSNLGWKNPIEESMQKKVSFYERPDNQFVESLLALPDALHLLGGIKGNSNARKVIAAKSQRQFCLGLISEDVDLRGMRAITRRVAACGIERPVAAQFDLVFCFGKSGVDWYRFCGFPAAKLIPFAYCVESGTSLPRSENATVPRTSPDSLRLIYVGALTLRKDVQLLLSSVAQFQNTQFKEVTLTIAGGGPEALALEQQAGQLGIREKVDFVGVIPNRSLPRLLSKHDVLVLPSQYDGWGAVVNEALHSGLFVVSSDACGASILFENHHQFASDLGNIFRRRNKQSLINVMSGLASAQMDQAARSQRASWAEENISPGVMARYLCDAIDEKLFGVESSNASPPWTQFSIGG